ncbi:putative transcriptional regulator, Crp/Fnr family [[Leptolyngbya] sp. PCC 7376]|nr:putative transcriptional regulator, Crp/Fnr family [[Leptolyngbya] sp. PCC 7376]
MDAQETSLYSFRRGQKIPKIQSQIWQIERGIVQLQTNSPQGDVTVLGWLQDGDFWGGSLTRLETIEAIALKDCLLKRFTSEELQASSRLQQNLLAQTVHRLQQSEYLLAIAGLKRIEDRLISLLLFLKQELGQTQDETIRLRCRFTHQNLADVIGTTRVTVTRLFKNFQNQGWLTFDDNRHLIITKNYQPEKIL